LVPRGKYGKIDEMTFWELLSNEWSI